MKARCPIQYEYRGFGMHHIWQKRACAVVLCVMLLCNGCGSRKTAVRADATDIVTAGQETKSTVLENELSYEIPVSTVNVLVDRNGYQAERNKEVFFLGNDLADEFQVMEASTKECVFTGKIEQGEEVCKGDFTELEKAGFYYIETEKIGRSYTFEIAEDMNDRMLSGLIAGSNTLTYEKTAKNVYELSMGIHSFLMALQCHGTIFEKDSDLVTWILKAASIVMEGQDEKGSIYKDYEATAAFCGVMNLCAKNFGKYDSTLATSYRTAGEKAWDWMQTQEAENQEDALFYAATAKFYVSANEEAKQEVESYLRRNHGKLTETYLSLFGSFLYLGAEKGTDRDLCHAVMQELVDETESICEKQKENPYLVYASELSEDMKQLLIISFIDYVSPSNEYAVVMENSLHYLAGRNPEGIKILNLSGEWAQHRYTEEWVPIWNGILINCLSSLIDDKD